MFSVLCFLTELWLKYELIQDTKSQSYIHLILSLHGDTILFSSTRTQAEGDNKPKQTRTRRLSTQSNEGTDSKGTQPKSGKYYTTVKTDSDYT